jgi:hypothetical protein
MHPGDRVRIEIDGVGVLENPVVQHRQSAKERVSDLEYQYL